MNVCVAKMSLSEEESVRGTAHSEWHAGVFVVMSGDCLLGLKCIATQDKVHLIRAFV